VHGAIKIKPHDYYVYPVCIQSAGGEAVVVSYKQVAEGMNMYFKNKSLYNSHAESIKANVVNYSWNNVADQLIQFIDPIITKQ
jgi:glycosyltransferase involved in cell wall biosynthesis